MDSIDAYHQSVAHGLDDDNINDPGDCDFSLKLGDDGILRNKKGSSTFLGLILSLGVPVFSDSVDRKASAHKC